MSPTIDYYFSLISPWSYLGNAPFQALAAQFNAAVIYHPLSTVELFPATGGLMLKDRAQPRKDYRMVELKRWRDHLGVALNPVPKHFPVAEAPASKLVLAAIDAGHQVAPLVQAIMAAVWANELNISDEQTLIRLADGAGLDGAALMAAASGYDQAFADQTTEAIKNGVFGYPTYILNGEIFWGQDRLDFLDRALSGR